MQADAYKIASECTLEPKLLLNDPGLQDGFGRVSDRTLGVVSCKADPSVTKVLRFAEDDDKGRDLLLREG